jgi:uncharacterized protein (TIGR03083 family)
MMQNPTPVLVADRFPALLNTLLDLLHSLTAAEWQRPTAAASWTVHDVALHLLGDDVGILSGRRDEYVESDISIGTWDELVTWINRHNDLWVQGTRRISPRLLCDLLRFTGDQVSALFGSLDLYALGGTVYWASPDPAPGWLILGREFTERWHHQQHIREAVGRPILDDPHFLAPVLATFVRALPQTYKHVEAAVSTCVTLTIAGSSGGSWSIVREQGQWQLYSGKPDLPKAEVVLPEDTAWRLFTKGIGKETARGQATFGGDKLMGEQMLEMVSIIA